MTTALLHPSPPAGNVPEPLAAALALPQGERTPRSAPNSVGIVVTGDNHLSAYLPRLSPQRRAERRARLRNAFAAAVTYAIEHGARLFAHVGDLFDTPTPGNEDRAFVAAQLARLRRAGVVCVAVSGNHDTPRMVTEQGGEAPQHVYAALDGLHYFSGQDTLIPCLANLNGLRLAVAGLTNNPVAAAGSDPLAGVRVDDPEGVLPQADVGLLLLHAGIEGLCQPNEGERIVTRASLDALPPIFRVAAAGHIHRFGRARYGERTVIVCGATERMEFGTQAGTSGFAWLELDREGVRRVEHVRIPEQPRADVMLTTAQIWPAGTGEQPEATGEHAASLRAAVGSFGPHGVNGELWSDGTDRRAGTDAVARIKQALAEVCTDETMVRLRLAGPLTLDQYHQLALRDVLQYGQQHAFSFDLNTSGLALLEPEAPPTAHHEGGPIAPVHEVERLLERWLAAEADPQAASDARAAAAILIERLRARVDREAGQ